MAETPQGGYHYFGLHTQGIRNSTSQLAPGVDIRGKGGYIVVAPSVVDGKPYKFIKGGLDKIASPFPEWLICEIKNLAAETPPDEGREVFDYLREFEPQDWRYGLKALSDECERVRQADEGTRNDTLNRAALALGQLINEGLLGDVTAREQLHQAALESGLEEAETDATISSGFEAAKIYPRVKVPGLTSSDKSRNASFKIIPERLKNAKDWLQEEGPPHPGVILTDLWDMGMKAALMGPAKIGKSFFLLQLLTSIAGGRPSFLKWEIPQPRRVLLVQLEIPDDHFHDRLAEVCKAMKINLSDLEDRLHIYNARGQYLTPGDAQEIIQLARKADAEIIAFDPVYKMIDGDESDQRAVIALLALFDRICEQMGAGLIYSHHYAKGHSGNKALVDRGSGSSLLARDFDFGIYLNKHMKDGLVVCETIARAYPPSKAFSVQWKDCIFRLSAEFPAIPTSNNSRRNGRRRSATREDIMALFEGGPLLLAVFEQRLTELGTQKERRALVAQLLDEGKLVKKKESGKGGHGLKYIGTPEQIKAKLGE